MSKRKTQPAAPQWTNEPDVLARLTIRLIQTGERRRFDRLLKEKHYLHSATLVGATLRYVVEVDGHWAALLTFSSAAWHLKPRDRWLHWNAPQVPQRRHLIAQNSRFLILCPPGQCPNLASRALKLVGQRLSADWQERFGHPILALETFVDPQHYRGTCYKAAGWERLGPTQGCARVWQDFYLDTESPKELWVRPLGPNALERLRAPQLDGALAAHARPTAPSCPLAFTHLTPLWSAFHAKLTDPRAESGQRYKLATLLTLTALAMAAGCQGPHAIFEFAQSLTHHQRRALRCPPLKHHPKQFHVPCERTFRRLLDTLAPASLKTVLVAWMAAQEITPLTQLHWDGKVLKNTRLSEDPDDDTPLTLVNVMTPDQRLVEQISVPLGTNEQNAMSQRLPEMDLAGLLVTADAAHTTKDNCRQLTQGNGADYFFFIKGNQSNAQAKAEQLLPGVFPPSSPNIG
jgi:hypothetical protein